MSQPPSTDPMTARRSGRCGASATIRWIGHGMAARLSAPIMPSARRWCAGSERPAGSAACSKRRSTALSGNYGCAACKIHRIRINTKIIKTGEVKRPRWFCLFGRKGRNRFEYRTRVKEENPPLRVDLNRGSDLLRGAVQLGRAVEQMTDDAPVRDGTTMPPHIDSKRRKKLRQKKTALGHAEDDHEEMRMDTM